MQYITSAGLTALALGPVTGLTFRLGDGFGYVPGASNTNITGNLVLQGVVSDPEVAGPNIYKYTISLSAIMDLEFGEIALFLPSGFLFSLMTYAQLVRKTANANDLDGVGGSIDVYINSSGISEVDLNATTLKGELASIDNLPTVADARFTMYSVPSPRYPDIPILAYRHGNYWGFSGYAVLASPTITASTLNTVKVNGEFHDVTGGDVLQFAAGGLQSTVRAVQAAAVSAGSTTIVFSSPLAQTATLGQAVYIMKPVIGVSVGGSGGVSGAYLALDGSTSMSGNVNFGNFRGTNVAAPTSPSDASTKAYSDAIRIPRVQVVTNVSGTFNLNCNSYDAFHLTLTGNTTLNFVGGNNNQSIIVKLKQDSTGGRTVQLPSNVRYNPSIPSYTASTTGLLTDKLGFQIDTGDSKLDFLALIKGIV